jgi:hypothetical protein
MTSYCVHVRSVRGSGLWFVAVVNLWGGYKGCVEEGGERKRRLA